ncbi:Fructose-bisphosphate aldolase 1 [Thelotrema lepadinum]|nr:Fructose-bisphosphate aldolase 1 [Thelotrema lepadinum]
MIDLSAEEVAFNVDTTAKYLERAAPMKLWIETELGVTGGEEDGVNNESIDNDSLYTQPADILNVYSRLSRISPYFSIAAAFGNVHGVYKPGNVRLHPELLSKHQEHVAEKIASSDAKPVFFVFHGGSGSSVEEFKTAISYGVVKVNIDTDTQYAFLQGIRDYILAKKDYLLTQVGNPEGGDKPNKKYISAKPSFQHTQITLFRYYDPRVWVREGEKTMVQRVLQALEDFNAQGQL